MTVYDLIRSSLRLIGELGPGRGASNAQLVDALFVLNGMIRAWGNEKLLIIATTPAQYPLVAGQQQYTLGAGGQFNAVAPIRIESANIIQDTGLRLPLEIINVAQWAAIPLQNVGSSIPTQMYPDMGYPLINLYFWPYPSVNLTLELYTWQVLQQFAAVTDTVDVPVGYGEALRYNLAVRLAPEWGKVLRPEVVALARETKMRLKSLNTEAIQSVCDVGTRQSSPTFFDWRIGQ